MLPAVDSFLLPGARMNHQTSCQVKCAGVPTSVLHGSFRGCEMLPFVWDLVGCPPFWLSCSLVSSTSGLVPSHEFVVQCSPHISSSPSQGFMICHLCPQPAKVILSLRAETQASHLGQEFSIAGKCVCQKVPSNRVIANSWVIFLQACKDFYSHGMKIRGFLLPKIERKWQFYFPVSVSCNFIKYNKK